MAHAGIDHLRPARGGSVAHAVAVGTQIRAALDHFAGDPELWLPTVVAVSEVAAARVRGMQQGLSTAAGCRSAYQSVVHSTLPAISCSPYAFGGKEPTGVVVP